MFTVFQIWSPYEEKNFFVTIGFTGAYLLIFLFIGKFRKLKGALPVLLGAELALNGIFTFAANYGGNQSIQVYLDYTKGNLEQTEAVKSLEDANFYRMDSLEKEIMLETAFLHI